MEYRRLGSSGPKVSAIGLGVMTFGGQTPEDDAFHQLDMAFAAGITLFDTAESYPTPPSAETRGRSEEVLGRWIAARGVRGEVVVATKVLGPANSPRRMHGEGSGRRLDRANIRRAVEGSLRRLGTDHIDLYQAHWSERAISTLGRSRYSTVPDAPGLVPIEETLAALSELVDEGKVRAIGVCNESPWGVMRYLREAECKGMARVASIQNGYSLLDRYFELGLAEMALNENVPLLAYSPLAGGTLTGKYARKAAAIPGSRSAESDAFVTRMLSAPRQRAIGAYLDLARTHGLDPGHMALAFVRQQPFVGSVLMAASSARQLAGNLDAIELQLPKDVMQAINAIHDASPNPK